MTDLRRCTCGHTRDQHDEDGWCDLSKDCGCESFTEAVDGWTQLQQFAEEHPITERQQEALDSLQDMGLWRGMHYDRKGREISPWEMMQLKTPDGRKDMGYARVGDTWVGGIQVSTVWLGMNHQWDDTKPPLIFETMVFVNDLYLDDDDESYVEHPLDRLQVQYSTLRQAQCGHRRFVRVVREFERRHLSLVKPHKTRNRHWRG